jgi:hypothetical protein
VGKFSRPTGDEVLSEPLFLIVDGSSVASYTVPIAIYLSSPVHKRRTAANRRAEITFVEVEEGVDGFSYRISDSGGCAFPLVGPS